MAGQGNGWVLALVAAGVVAALLLAGVVGLVAARQDPAAADVAGPPAAAPADDPLLGTWATSFVADGDPVSGTATFAPGGQFAGSWLFGGPKGGRAVDDTGTWHADGDRLTIAGRATGTVVRRFTRDGDVIRMQLAEHNGMWVTFTRQR